jgi:hypothetical protein
MMDVNQDKLNPDKLFSVMKDAMADVGLNFMDRQRFDEIFEFNELCQQLVEKCKKTSGEDDYEFPFIYLTGKLFNRLTPEVRRTFLQDFRKEIEEWS